MKHTPAPWTVVTHTKNCHMVGDSFGTNICAVSSNIADAVLISEVPVMLALLEKFQIYATLSGAEQVQFECDVAATISRVRHES